jgi:AbrB family looped-hinge helix DNA binding protein
MQHMTTISQKGQVVIPKQLREKLGFTPSTVLKVQLKNNDIIMSKATNVDDVFGMFKAKKMITKKDIKETYKTRTASKFSDR